MGCFLECNRDEGTLVLHSLISDSVCRPAAAAAVVAWLLLGGRRLVGWAAVVVEASCYRTRRPPGARRSLGNIWHV